MTKFDTDTLALAATSGPTSAVRTAYYRHAVRDALEAFIANPSASNWAHLDYMKLCYQHIVKNVQVDDDSDWGHGLGRAENGDLVR